MSQNFNGYNGLPRPGDPQNGYGELANSLIFPGALPFQPYQQVWPSTPGWQPPPGQETFSNGNPFQVNNNGVGSNGYFATQQDYVAFDDGDDFYNNEEEDTTMQQAVGGTATSNGPARQNLSGNPRGILSDSAGPSGNHTPQPKPQNIPPSGSQAGGVEQAPSNPGTTKAAAQDKLAELRARLLSQKRVGGKTPTPESNTQKPGSSNNQPAPLGSQSVEEQNNLSPKVAPANSSTRTSNGAVKSTVSDKSNQDAKSITKPSALTVTDAPAPQQTTTSTDIEMLLAEARNTTLTKEETQLSNKASSEGLKNGQPNPARSTATRPAANPVAAAPSISRQQSLNGSHVSSEASEQGEIREEPKQPVRVPTAVPSEPTVQSAPKQSAADKPAVQEKPSEQPNGAFSKQQPAKIDTSLANKQKSGSGTASAKPKSPPSVRTPSTSKARDFRDAPTTSDREQGDRYSRIKDRFAEAEWIAQERRQESDRERPREPYGRDAHVREPYSRETRQYETFRPNYSNRQNIIEENERAAAEYKRNLQLSKPEDRDVVMAESSPIMPKTSPKVSSDGRAAEYFADVDEWLEMTGYHDTAYRKKALARHRKLVQLDKERAELEQEAQIEHERHAQIARAQSVKPRESVEGTPLPLRSAIATRVFASFAMPPPPVPAKDSTDDVGIQIKDLAQRGAASGTQAFHESPNPLTPGLKRQHSGDVFESQGGRSLDKMPRTDSKEFSPEKKVQAKTPAAKTASGSLESRISVDNGQSARHRAGHQGRRSAWEDSSQEVHLVHAMATHPIVDQVTAEMVHPAKETAALVTMKHTMAALAVTTITASTMTAVQVPAMIPTQEPFVVDINRTSLQGLGVAAVVEGVEDT
ncbi:hypothetical protein MMC30_007355 [Trapelia coarctata]|nr:hypothetical protein [Trapelia coarctata]